MPKLFLFILLLTAGVLSAQVVNIESLRSFADSSGFHGVENLNVNYRRNTRELLNVTNNLSLKYQKKRQVFLFLNTIDLQLANSTVLEETSFFHLRYNYRQSDHLVYEAFAQYQRNIPLRINPRILIGAGPRFIIFRESKFITNLGLLAMYEYDDEFGNENINRDYRMSAYMTFGYDGGDRFNWMNFVYYQPRFDKFEDYRVNLESQLRVIIFKGFAFVTTVNFKYDTFPVEDPDIPDLTLSWINGLSYRF